MTYYRIDILKENGYRIKGEIPFTSWNAALDWASETLKPDVVVELVGIEETKYCCLQNEEIFLYADAS